MVAVSFLARIVARLLNWFCGCTLRYEDVADLSMGMESGNENAMQTGFEWVEMRV